MKSKWMKTRTKSRKRCWVTLFTGLVVITLLCVFSVTNISYASWVQEDDGIKYMQEDGQYAVGFLDVDDNRYYFDSDGHLVYGKFYVEEEDCYYYSNEQGIVQYGAIRTEKEFFIADYTGRLLTGFVEYDGQRYYFNSIAQLVVGWFKHEDAWYYADSLGRVMTGFVTVDGYRYYLNSDGRRVEDTIMEIDGITYCFNSDGSVDENATILYPVLRFMNDIRVQNGKKELTLNSKVQACAIVRAAELVNGFVTDSQPSIEKLLSNRGVLTEGGYEFSYGGIEEYSIEQLMLDMNKDDNCINVLLNDNISEVGLGFYQKDNIVYYDIIFITKANE